MLAIVAQALLPIVHPVAPSRAQVADAAAFGKIVICTPYGFKVVSLDEVPGDDMPRKAAAGQFCPLCQAAQTAVALPAPDGPDLGRCLAGTTVAFSEAGAAPSAGFAPHLPQARAPPLPIG